MGESGGGGGGDGAGGKSPAVQGYGFVVTPSPMPGVDDSPLMTWGAWAKPPTRDTLLSPLSSLLSPRQSAWARDGWWAPRATKEMINHV